MTNPRNRAITGFGVVLLLLLAFSIFMFLNFKTVVVKGHSMENTFHTGDRVFVSSAYWLVGPIRHKDIVVLTDDKTKNPDGYMIKRVYKMGGEQVDRYNAPRNWPLGQPFTVPEDSLYVLGDNRDQSEDSRFYGPVPKDHVLGKVVVAK